MLKEGTKKKGRKKSPSPFSRHRPSGSTRDPFEEGESWSKDKDKESPPQESIMRAAGQSMTRHGHSLPRTHPITRKEHKMSRSHPQQQQEDLTSGEDSDSADKDYEKQVYLNIGGCKYVTTLGTLCKVCSASQCNSLLVY
jgi:hypothetical protein